MKKKMCILFLLLVMEGCGLVPHTAHFTLDDVLKSESPVHHINIAVAPFTDKIKKQDRVAYHKIIGIEHVLVEYFEHIKLFARQDVVDSELNEPNFEQLTKLKAKGYDAILLGSVGRYRVEQLKGRLLDRSPGLAGLIAVFPIFAVPLVGADMTEELPYMGYVELSNLKLIETSSGRIIWEGSASGWAERTMRAALTSGQLRVADDALKNAANSLAEQLKKASFQ